MKTITGLFAILLGGLGVLVTLALVGGVWWGASLLSAPTENVIAQADRGLAQAGEAIENLRQQVASNAAAAEEVRAAAAAARERPNTPATRAEVERLRVALLAGLARADAQCEPIVAAAGTVESAADLAEQGGGKSRADRLRSVVGKVREAEKELTSVRSRSTALREEDAPPTAKSLEETAQRLQKALGLLAAALSDAKQESDGLRGELPEARRALNVLRFTGAGVMTLILLWIGLGQLAIVGWGRRRLAAPLPAPQPPAAAR